jgi:IMP cyclohydrolase
MKIKCPDKDEIVNVYLTAGKVYDVIRIINDDLVVIKGDHGDTIPVYIRGSSHTGCEPWEIVE